MSTIRAACPMCTKKLVVPAKYAGRVGKCPNCGAMVQFPALTGVPAPSGPAPGMAPPAAFTASGAYPPVAPAPSWPGTYAPAAATPRQAPDLPSWQWTMLVIALGCAGLVLGAGFLPWFNGIGITEFPIVVCLSALVLIIGLFLVVSNSSSRLLLALGGGLATVIWLILLPLLSREMPTKLEPAKTALYREKEGLHLPIHLATDAGSKKKKPRDVMVVLEGSARMAPRLDSIKKDIRGLAKELWDKDPEARIGLTVFRTHLDKKTRVVYEEKGSGEMSTFTRDAPEFSRKVGVLVAGGGGDLPESSFDAVDLGSRQPFREDADKIIILITDAAPKRPDKILKDDKEAADALRKGKIKQFHIMCPREFVGEYKALTDGFEGQHFELRLGDDAGFRSILEKLSKEIADISFKQRALTPSAVKKSQIRADVLFLLDTTGSMQPAIRGVQNGISNFARELSEKKLDARFGLISYKDQFVDSRPLEVLTFRQEPYRLEETVLTTLPEIQTIGLGEKGPFFTRPEDLATALDSMTFSGGHTEQSSLDALAAAAKQPFRVDADKAIVLIADSPPVTPDKEVIDAVDLIDLFKEKKVEYVHLSIPDGTRPFFQPLHKAGVGKTFVSGAPLSLAWMDDVPPPGAATSGGSIDLGDDAAAPEARAKAKVGVWIAFFAATGMALCLLIVSLSRPPDLSRKAAFSDLPGVLQRYGPVLTVQGFAVMLGLLLVALGKTG